MSDAYGISTELSLGDSSNNSILALNRNIRQANELARNKYTTQIADLTKTYRNTNPTLDKVKEGGEATADALYTIGGAVKTAYRTSRRAGALGIGGSSATTEPAELAFTPETPLAPPLAARGGVAGSTERIARGEEAVRASPSGLRSALRTTATPEGDASLRAAEALQDANAPQGVELGSLGTQAVNRARFTAEAGRGLGLTGSPLDGLELPGTVPTPSRLAPPSSDITETAREAGRVAGQQAGGGEFGSRLASESAAQRARSGESLSDITGFVGREVNPAARVSAGQGRQIAQSADDLFVRVGGGIGEGGDSSAVVASALPTVNKALGKVKFGGTEVRNIPSMVQPSAPQTLTQMREASEAEEASKAIAPPVATDTESVVKNGIGALDKGGLVASGLSKVSGALTAVNVIQGGYDALDDILNNGIQGKNIEEKRANVAGIVSGGADALAVGIRKATTTAATEGVEAGGEALSTAAGLEEAGAAADATGVGALVGLGLGVAGAGVGLYGAVESYLGEKKQKQAAKQKLQQAKAASPPQAPMVAQQDTAGSGAEVRQSVRGIGAVS